MVNRKRFLHLSAASAAGLILPGFLNGKENNSTQITAETNRLADIALNAARSKGAMYADVRIARSKHTGAYKAGIRMFVNGRWAFASTGNLTSQSIPEFIGEAMANAKSVQARHQYDLKEKHEVWRCIFAHGAASRSFSNS
jgi:TldD protein